MNLSSLYKKDQKTASRFRAMAWAFIASAVMVFGTYSAGHAALAPQPVTVGLTGFVNFAGANPFGIDDQRVPLLHERKLATGHVRQGQLVEAAHGRKRHNRCANGAPGEPAPSLRVFPPHH